MLRLPELVDLYGRNGFDVLAVTDHVLREDDPFATDSRRCVHAANHGAYLDELADEAARAREEYDLLVLPGLELSFNAYDARRAGHALALGLREFVHVDAGLEPALERARDHGAALIAAHPSPPPTSSTVAGRRRSRSSLACGRSSTASSSSTGTSSSAGSPTLGSPASRRGDFHRPEHLATWKTLLPCAKDERAIVEYLRSPAPAYLAPLTVPEAVAA